ncbi:MAG TPA: SGNH/GDSL hydrolase family protein [Candidatus Paceibacterota bacterium]|nr:SGNH/GDSL hydrolase family protein [Verrucomicrobiota bacterium]HSA11308.1 SGNH/GDSL hydrolase family protein [Candidatus Paceibacterota bacterium]
MNLICQPRFHASKMEESKGKQKPVVAGINKTFDESGLASQYRLMRTRFVWSSTWLALAMWASLSCGLFAQTTPAGKQPPEVRWAKAIGDFEAADRTNPPPKDGVLFIGSSSIRRWTNIASAFPGHKVINRGFGGSQLADSVAFAGRIVTPYRPRLVLLYAGDNDIAGGKSPETVLADFKAFVGKIHAALPRTRIGYIAIKPCPSRERFLDQVRKTNRLIRDHCGTDERLVFADVFTPMLTAEGKPRADLCVKDMLHLNEQGYELWASVLRPLVDKYAGPGGGGSQP